MSGIDVGALRGFYEGLFGDSVDETRRLVLWTPRDKRSHWTSSVEEAVAVSEATAAASDLYYGCCLQDRSEAEAERIRRTEDSDMEYCRGYASTTAVMPGLWLDLDIAGGGHEKIGLPKNQAEADQILTKLPHDPTAIIRTGGGTHVYWLFKEPWVFDVSGERDQAAAIIRGWQTLAIDAAADMGFIVDSTHDLSRVLRPLGTVNHKYGSLVGLLPMNGGSLLRYNPSDFEDWSAEVVPVNGPRHSKVEALGDLREDLQPPAEKLVAMLNLAPQFAQTWRRERREFPSQSEYDLSLASMAARADWTDEEIVALIVSHRRGGGEPLRLDRPKYYTGLIGKARAGTLSEDAHDRINERVESVTQGETTPEDERDGFLTDISALLGFRVRRILKFVTDPPQYRLVLESGTIHLGGVESILNSSKFRAAIAAVSGTLIQRFNGTRWDPVAQAILQAVEELDLGADSSAEGLVGEWLGDYLAQHRPVEDRNEAIPIRMPFFDPEGLAAFFLPEFKTWLKFHRDETLGRRQIATLLRSAGVVPKTVAFVRETDNHKTTVSVWVVPHVIANVSLNRTNAAELPRIENVD